jgi:hypothetical protein
MLDVAFTGRAEPHEAPLVAPISDRPCVWFDVEVKVRTGFAKYRSIKRVRSNTPFLLVAEDGTRAQVEVHRVWLANPGITQFKTKMKGAPKGILSGSSTNTHRVTESVLPTGAVVTVLSRVKQTDEGYRTLAVSGGHSVSPGAVVLGGAEETVVAMGDRAALGSALVKGVLLGAVLFGIGLAWSGLSIWFLATP